MNALRFADGADDDTAIIEGWLCPYGGSFNGRDSYGTYFSARTDFCLDWFAPDARPVLYNHGLDEEMGVSPIGRIRSLESRDKGLWMEAQIDKRNQYFNDIAALVKAGKLGLSSAAMAHLVEIDQRSGEILRWPLIEGTTTPTESNLLATIDLHTFKSHYRAAGIDISADVLERIGEDDGTRADLTAKKRDDLDDSDFAYVDKDGGRHLPIENKAHVKAALSRFDQTDFESDSAKATARRKILAAAKKFGIDVADDDKARGAQTTQRAANTPLYDGSYEDLIADIADLLNPATPFGPACWSYIVATYPSYVIACQYVDGDDSTYWRVEYSLDANGEPVLGTVTQVEQTYVPVQSARAMAGPLYLNAQLLTRHAAALAHCTQDVSARRSSEGRALSDANRRALRQAGIALVGVSTAFAAEMDHIDIVAAQTAQAAQMRDPEEQRRQIEINELFLASLLA